jgi:hypothetical protein
MFFPFKAKKHTKKPCFSYDATIFILFFVHIMKQENIIAQQIHYVATKSNDDTMQCSSQHSGNLSCVVCRHKNPKISFKMINFPFVLKKNQNKTSKI